MARFIKIQNEAELILVNTDMVESVLLLEHIDDVKVVILGAKARNITRVGFETKEEAVEFLDKNFVLFNS